MSCANVSVNHLFMILITNCPVDRYYIRFCVNYVWCFVVYIMYILQSVHCGCMLCAFLSSQIVHNADYVNGSHFCEFNYLVSINWSVHIVFV